MDKRIIEVRIADLYLKKRGALEGAEDINLFRFTLTYPAEGVAGIETIKTIKATKKLPKNWASDFDRSIVFKTPLRGKAKLKVEALAIDRDSESEKFFKALFKKVFGAALGVWTGGFSNAYVGAITSAVGESLTDQIDSDEDVDILGTAEFTLNSQSLKTSLTSKLTVKKSVVKKELNQSTGRHPSQRRRRIKNTIVIPKGDNGSITLTVTDIG